MIDNRKCIGCHACTTACKSEHNVPVGVNRTWVKQVEKGVFPDTRRLFSVLRCNHCSDAPCVDICPTGALFNRDDGIVDFDSDRCIGCKSCMQACPYDALYIDPETHTAAKCNYCAHRVDIGLEPACVNVCPEHAIISGDMDDPDTEIAQLLSRQQVSVRKEEKGTLPNVYYIDGDQASLNPSATPKDGEYFWNSQTMGVGHYAREAEKMAFANDDVVAAILSREKHQETQASKARPRRSVEVIMDRAPKRIYDTPDKGILWGWEVSAYVVTKAIAAGAFLVPFIAVLLAILEPTEAILWFGYGISLLFLLATGLLLVKDLDKPGRFLYVLLRPQWNSWLVRGGYAIAVYGGLITLLAVLTWFGANVVYTWPITILTGLLAIVVAVYTAFLFAQAKGRDFWQSPSLALHMLVHSVLAGAASFGILAVFIDTGAEWMGYVAMVMGVSIAANLAILCFELLTTHPTVDAKRTVEMIVRGRYSTQFYLWVLVFGNAVPGILLLIFEPSSTVLAVAGALSLLGIYVAEKIWVEAPQRIPLS